MKLIPISEYPDAARILYDLLAERDPVANISHKVMPTWEEHLAFVEKMDSDDGDFYARYGLWSLIEVDGRIVGSIYITQRDEIGIAIFKSEQRKGYTSQVIRMLPEMWGLGPYYANVAPNNEPSRKMFEKLGFKLVQVTYALEAE